MRSWEQSRDWWGSVDDVLPVGKSDEDCCGDVVVFRGASWVGEKNFLKVFARKFFAWSFFSTNLEKDLKNNLFNQKSII